MSVDTSPKPQLDEAELVELALGTEAKPKSSSTSFALKAWTFTWPKLLAIAIVIGILQFAYAVEWKPSFVLPSPFTVLPSQSPIRFASTRIFMVIPPAGPDPASAFMLMRI